MKLYTLLFGKSKRKMKPIMIDEKHKCVNYMKARENNVEGHHAIEESEKGSVPWKQKTATIGGNKYVAGKNNGWIGKNGFNPHT